MNQTRDFRHTRRDRKSNVNKVAGAGRERQISVSLHLLVKELFYEMHTCMRTYLHTKQKKGNERETEKKFIFLSFSHWSENFLGFENFVHIPNQNNQKESDMFVKKKE